MSNRLALIQLALFLVISIGCAYYVATNVLGPQTFHPPFRVAVQMPDSGGISPDSQVTYRGVKVGTVSDVSINPDGHGVSVHLTLDPGVRVPASAKAVVSMDTPLALQHLDLRPGTDSGPYLRDGSVIAASQTATPLPLESLLMHATEFTDSLNPQDVATLSDAMASGLNATGPQLTRILDNTATLMRAFQERQPQIQRLLDGTRTLAGPNGAEGDRLRVLAANMRAVTGSLRGQEPQLRSLLDTAPATTERINQLLVSNEPAVTALLGNLVTTSQIVSIRVPAMEYGIATVPNALARLGSIVHGDTADFYLVATQGPICFTSTERRPPTATDPRQPGLDWHCPGDQPNLDQRGAANAPTPTASTYDPATGDTAAGFQLGSSGGQSSALGPRSWYSIPLQGVR